MTTRPPLKAQSNQKRNSAVYIGSDSQLLLSSTPPSIPDLPEPPPDDLDDPELDVEPPSPGGRSITSTGSHLPSPPATNSTGSGSTGDPGSVAFRQKPLPFGTQKKIGANSTSNMLNEANVKAFHDAFSRPHHRSGRTDDFDDDDDDYDHNDNDEDNTARLDRRLSVSSSREDNENEKALQRVKSLTQRNRMVLDKLSSYSRLSTPSPNSRNRESIISNSRSPTAGGSSKAASSSTSSSSSASGSSTRPALRSRHSAQESTSTKHSEHHSGSETERESLYAPNPPHSGSSLSPTVTTSILLNNGSNRPTTPVSHGSSSVRRLRLISAPASPAKALQQMSSTSSGSNASNSPSRRKRVSLAMSEIPRTSRSPDQIDDDEYGHDETSPLFSRSMRRDPGISQRALAAVASSRRSPTVGASVKKRAPLPREFRASMDGEVEAGSIGRHSGDLDLTSSPSSTSQRLQLSPRHRLDSTFNSSSRIGAGALGKSSTLRERRQNQARWQSEDMSSVSPQDDHPDRTGRRQSLRGGSAESALTATRSLVGEGLRAAGLASRRTSLAPSSQDSFDNDSSPLAERSGSRLGAAATTSEFSRTRAGTITGPRAQTSMAQYQVVEAPAHSHTDELRTAPPALRTHKSAYPLAKSEVARVQKDERAPSSLSRYNSPIAAAREIERHASPFGARRGGTPAHQPQPSIQQSHSEHTRLMNDSLVAFESHLSRIPQLNTSPAAADLLKNASAVVFAAEKLNLLLRHGTEKALSEQIDAEVGDTGGEDGELIEVWRKVGSEYREGLRASDELVRNVTGFLLGVGRAVKDLGSGVETHGRTVSLDDDSLLLGRNGSRLTPERGITTPVNGRRSVTESRRSWEDKEDAIRRRPDSVLGSTSRPATSLNTHRDRERIRDATPPQPPSKTPARNPTPNGITGSASMRRLNPVTKEREPLDLKNLIRDSAPAMATTDSQETVHPTRHDPSPTPAARIRKDTQDRRSLAPLSIPKPLPTLPSEATNRRGSVSGPGERGGTLGRRKTVSTVRAPAFPSLTTPNATTAVTPHTVSNSPDKLSFPLLLRTDSNKSNNKNSVTFSRSSTVSALSGLQQQQRADQRIRTLSSTSHTDEEVAAPDPISRQASGGSETERDVRKSVDRDRPRASLDGGGRDTVHAADRSAASVLAFTTSRTRERRRTVVDMFPPTGQ